MGFRPAYANGVTRPNLRGRYASSVALPSSAAPPPCWIASPLPPLRFPTPSLRLSGSSRAAYLLKSRMRRLRAGVDMAGLAVTNHSYTSGAESGEGDARRRRRHRRRRRELVPSGGSLFHLCLNNGGGEEGGEADAALDYAAVVAPAEASGQCRTAPLPLRRGGN